MLALLLALGVLFSCFAEESTSNLSAIADCQESAFDAPLPLISHLLLERQIVHRFANPKYLGLQGAQEKFCKALLASTQGGYVWCGVKPACFCPLSCGFAQEDVLSIYLREGLKRSHRLPKRLFAYCSQDNLYANYDCFYFLDLEHLAKVVFKHGELFKSILGKDFTLLGFLRSILHEKTDLCLLLKENVHLIGIVLGYGSENARLHCEYERAWKEGQHHEEEQLIRLMHPTPTFFLHYLPRILFSMFPAQKDNAEIVRGYFKAQKLVQQILSKIKGRDRNEFEVSQEDIANFRTILAIKLQKFFKTKDGEFVASFQRGMQKAEKDVRPDGDIAEWRGYCMWDLYKHGKPWYTLDGILDTVQDESQLTLKQEELFEKMQ